MPEPITLERLAAMGLTTRTFKFPSASLTSLDGHTLLDLIEDGEWYATLSCRVRDMDDVRRLVAMMGMEVRGE